MGAEQLASQKVGVVADALAVLHVLAPSAQYGVGLFPQLLGHDRRYDLAGFILEHDPFLRREEFLLFGEHIHHLDLVAYIISLVFRIGNHIGHGRVGNLVAVEVSIAFFPKEVFQLLHGIFVRGIKLKKLTHHRCLSLVNDQTFLIFTISKDTAVSQHHILLDGLLMAELHTGGQFAEFILCDG